MIIAVDIDDTLCTRPEEAEHLGSPTKYEYCVPILDMIEKVNVLYDRGNTIILYTSRGMSSIGTNVEDIDKKLRKVTEQKLNEWGVKYSKLVFGKIHFDYLIDDKALSISEFVNKFNHDEI